MDRSELHAGCAIESTKYHQPTGYWCREGETLVVTIRKCTGTYLRLAGVDVATSQHYLRHADPTLTLEVYNDIDMADMQPALDAMPALRVMGS
jgi:hypothetical protein